MAARIPFPRWVVATGVVGFSYVLVQLLVLDPSRALEWDEAVYLAEVNPAVDAIAFDAHRARGITLLVAPFTAAGLSVPTTRSVLVVASAVALVGAFSAVASRPRWVTPLACLLFAGTWLSILYGSEVSPNWWSAIALVAALGFLGRDLTAPSRWTAGALLLAMTVAGLMRPFDLTVALLPVGVLMIVRGLAHRRQIVLLLVGGVLGWVPWLMEATVRWGSPMARLEAISVLFEGAPDVNPVLQHLALLNGPLIGPEPDAEVAPMAVVWLVTITAAAVYGAVVNRKDENPMFLTAAAGVIVGYLFFSVALAPRFLLPAYALLAVPAASGVVHATGLKTKEPRSKATSLARAGIAVLLILTTTWHIAVALSTGRMTTVQRADAPVLAQTLEAGPDCRFQSQYGYPQIAYYSGCRGSRFTTLQAADEAGYPVVLAITVPEEVEGWAVESVPGAQEWSLLTRMTRK